MEIARLGVLLDQQTIQYRWRYGVDVFEAYIGEILSHRGIQFEWLHSIDDLERIHPDMVIVAAAEDDHDTNLRLWNYVEQGGKIISYGGLHGLASRIGYVPGPTLGVGYADPIINYVSCGQDESWRFLKASKWLNQGEIANNQVKEYGSICEDAPRGTYAGSLLIRAKVGQGMIERWSVDIPTTVVMFQQGSQPVVKDGIPAPDGTADVRDGVLKADDVYDMDWHIDRRTTETGALYFAFPYADWWREQLVGHLIHTASEGGLSLPFIGYWPDGISDVALISHDSDYNEDEHADSTLEVLQKHDVRSTWCMIEPGYSEGTYKKVKENGHELAFHYNAVAADDGFWDKDEFHRQFAWLTKAIGQEMAVSNKNHLTRNEGWGELFQWCEQCGIESDQTRGPSKKGNVGFLYGTCRPYYPISRYDEQNRLYSVLEIGFLTPDMDHGKWSDNSIIKPLMRQVQAVSGVAHFLFHQIHLHKMESVRQAFAKTVSEARKHGFVFWTGQEILEWEKKRRSVKIKTLEKHSKVVTEGAESSEIVIWLPLSAGEETRPNEITERHYGLLCRKQTCA
jgi:peptidoglycan/xylan/chitin deacetylase (PgdA/CDA1 family)